MVDHNQLDAPLMLHKLATHVIVDLEKDLNRWPPRQGCRYTAKCETCRKAANPNRLKIKSSREVMATQTTGGGSTCSGLAPPANLKPARAHRAHARPLSFTA